VFYLSHDVCLRGGGGSLGSDPGDKDPDGENLVGIWEDTHND
jgi:hypothetical protein